jgi:D-lactate dehydrogenase
MKIHVFETEGWEREPFRSLEDKHELNFTSDALSADNAAEHADAEAVSTFIYSSLGADVLDALPALRSVASWTRRWITCAAAPRGDRAMW